jgi:hypothetical protein
MKNNRKPGKRRIECMAIGSTAQAFPLPPRLATSQAILDEARELFVECFPDPKGKKQFQELRRRGWRLMSWPDGTRAAYKIEGGGNLSQAEGISVYRFARTEIEKRLRWAEQAKGAPRRFDFAGASKPEKAALRLRKS